jgi:tryptophan 2,3-dioxygenase
VLRGPQPVGLPVLDEARWLVATMGVRVDDYERDALRLSMLPVYTMHDEYVFIRTLQLFETTFATLAVLLQRVLGDLTEGDERSASTGLRDGTLLLTESSPLFSMLATMQVEAFQVFRDFTSGASAIQSRSYKLVESLCRRPDAERLDSAAYTSVPDVRRRVLEGGLTVDDVLDLHLGRPGAGPAPDVVDAMEAFSAAVLRWRQTHYSLAVRALGQRTGTGYTEGTPYLDVVRRIPVFRARPGGPGAGERAVCPVSAVDGGPA